jgi:hypothetical protein
MFSAWQSLHRPDPADADALVPPDGPILAHSQVKSRHHILVIRAPKAAAALAWYREGCVADGAAPGAGTEEGTGFLVTSLLAISLADHPR